MTEKTKGEVEQASAESRTSGLGGLLTEKISRRSFGKLLGAQTVLASTVSLSGCLGGGGGSDDETSATPETPVDPGTQALSRAAFVATISDYFDWVHYSEYVDPYAKTPATFVDVVLGATDHAKEIEMALEAGVVSNSDGEFYPAQSITREDAADMYVKAFRIPASATNALTGFSDADTISASRKASVNAIVAAGYMGGTSSTLFSPKGTLSGNDAKAILARISSSMVAPPQVMCKSGTTAPRRYVTISTPTDGATIYYTYTYDTSEPKDPDPATAVAATTTGYSKTNTYSFDLRTNGVLQFVNPTGSSAGFTNPNTGAAVTDYRFYRLKAVAVKNGMVSSPIVEYSWNIYRPVESVFYAEIMHEATATSPKVYRISNRAEYYQAHVFYIEGSARGICWDAGEYSYTKANLKSFIDTIATKPYDLVLGHHHPDHSEQISNFTNAGVAFYLNAIEQANLINSGRADQKAAAAAAVVIPDGHTFPLGNCTVSYWMQPGHTDGLATLLVNETGWVYASDMWGCNRAYTADTTQYNGVKVDRMLSLVQQLLANYQKSSTSGAVTELTNAHQERSVGMVCAENFIECFQQLIDLGDAATEPSVRGGISGNPTSSGNSRSSRVGDMWRNKDWMDIGNSLGSSWSSGTISQYSAPVATYPSGVAIDYNATDGHKKYSVLSNVQIAGGTLVGVDVYWGAAYSPTYNGVTYNVPRKLSNKFDPWTYAYTINVQSGTSSIVFKPTAMSNKIASMKVNGAAIKQGDSVTVAVSAGTKITVDIVAPDGSTSSSYTFTVVLV